MATLKHIYQNSTKAKLILFMLILLFCFKKSFSQPIKITGKVINANSNEIVKGATVSCYSCEISSQSGEYGLFQISVSDTTRNLFVTHIGFETAVVDIRKLSPQRDVIVYITPNSSMLNEVVVSTGYQTLPKERSTGSYSTIDNKLLNQRISTSIIGRLEGMATGLLFSPSPAPPITVRGINSLSSGMEPLIVVDNFPYQGNIDNINPNDISSITILKDAAAASIWGARAGNGVIVITTKKGRLNQPIQVSMTMNQTYIAKPKIYRNRNISSGDFIEVEKLLFDNGYYLSMENDPMHPPLSPVVELLIRQRDGLISQSDVDKEIAYFSKQNVLDDFDKYWYSSGLNQQYNINMQGGGNQSTWLFSLGYDKNKSTLQDNSERVTMRINNQYRPFNKVQLTTEIVATQNVMKVGRQPYSNANLINNAQKYLYPYADLVDDNGNALPLINNFRSEYIDTAGNGQLLNWRYYPYAEKQNNIQQMKSIDVLANLALRYNISKSIQLEARYQYEKQQKNADLNQSMSSYFTRNMINSYAQDDGNGNMLFPVPKGGILDENEEMLEANSFRLQSDLSYSWGKHNIFGVIGFEAGLVKNRGSYYRTYGYNTENQSFVETDNTTLFQQYYYSAIMLPIFSNRNITGTNNGRVSYYFNGSYDYAKRYVLTFSARRDQSNLFGSRTNERTVPLWSSGVSWNLLEESFIKIPTLSILKLRFTYGFNGNMNPSSSAVTLITHYPGTGQLPPYAAIGMYPNPTLRWEKVRNINFGLDISTREDRFSGRLELFRKKITDLSTGVPIDYTAGFTTIAKNAATMYGKGMEIEVTGKLGNNVLRYTPTLLLSFIANKISDDYLATNLRASSYISGNGLTRIPGKSPYSVISYPWVGLNGDNGNPVGRLNGQNTENYSEIINQTTVDDAFYHGSSIPTVFGTFRNGLTWKNFSLSVQLLYKGGYYFRRPTIRYGLLYDNWLGHSDFSLRWQKPGDENSTSVPSLQYPLVSSQRDNFYAYSEATVEKGDHIRLQDINLSYNFSRSILGKFSSFQVYAIANNLGIVWRANKKGLDPEALNTIGQPYNLSFGFKANF
ncbi:MAG: hypothetical protein BGO56_00465 [Sphingobacteriales bacterium 48-107]|jgi:TonB-linked SusC/RagA family outer membrane protein|uniref:SusC/RagA family TonB-linked outer membrane protein n=1 Tax=uncultured Dysgonomonas sp. TaxID=206096 RepID=UPI00092B0C5C|nr:SusC/RagA family TonB-linked outer membrane protein [uncultured Dysgonomonas sp.]OJW45685.1 MAG: hypothetical protein BGO56_00465 [Sphingobacteriales bacterium 48-107]